jgi:hypothetical protein
MFHYFKILYFTCTLFTKLIYNEYIGSYFLSHVVLKLSPVNSPRSSCQSEEQPCIAIWSSYALGIRRGSKQVKKFMKILTQGSTPIYMERRKLGTAKRKFMDQNTRLRAQDHQNSSTLIGGKGGLRDQRSM